VVAAGLHRRGDAVAQPPQHDHVLHRRARSASASSSTAFIATGWPRRQVPSAVITALAGPSLQPCHQRLRPEAAEERHQHRAELEHREEGDEGLGQVGHEQAHHVARPDAQAVQRAGQARHLGVELGGSSACAVRPGLRLPTPGRSASQRAVPRWRSRQLSAMLVVPPTHQSVHSMPLRPSTSLRVRLEEAEVAEGQHLARDRPAGSASARACSAVPVGHAEVPHEGREVAAGHLLGRGHPGERRAVATA
jgi:hypothetical protein